MVLIASSPHVFNAVKFMQQCPCMLRASILAKMYVNLEWGGGGGTLEMYVSAVE